MKLLVLYEELATYFLSSISYFARAKKVEVVIIRKPINKEAPFQFSFPDNLTIYDRTELGEEGIFKLFNEFKPDALYCGGWSYKPYLKLCQKQHGKLPVFVGFDNWWVGNLKQRLAVLLSPFLFKNKFDACFVPGEKQAEFGRRLGYKPHQIFKGVYCCDNPYFSKLYELNIEKKRREFPHRFIYVGRYVAAKEVELMWSAFIEATDSLTNDWELWCLGTGDIKPVEHPRIKHFGFIQPSQMNEFIANAGVFVLPSSFEPWGVAVHEFAVAGFPLILSNKIGAAEVFLKDGENGYMFESQSKSSLINAFVQMINKSDEELFQMSEFSNKMGDNINQDTFSESLEGLMKI
jgi:glycosyltransferase involved in cell wall biosynthesis